MKRWVNEVHIWALQYTFVPRANLALKFFADSWNAHPISIEKIRSSEQLWILWMNIQKEELCTYKVSFILIPQVKSLFRFLVSTWERIYNYSKHFYSKHRSMWWHKVLSSKRELLETYFYLAWKLLPKSCSMIWPLKVIQDG